MLRIARWAPISPALALGLACRNDVGSVPTAATLDEEPSAPAGSVQVSGVRESPSSGAALAAGQGPAEEPSSFPAHWCPRAGATEQEWVATVTEIAKNYSAATDQDCETQGLTAAFDHQNRTDWRNYLVSYSLLMAGCPLLFGPVDGGILAFGPGNTVAIGVPRPPLGKDDAALLIERYTAAFAAALDLQPEQADAVTTHLWQTAQAQIDPAASETLSVCPTGADAGS